VVVSRYFFEALGAPDTAGTIAARAKGATMPNLNATIIAGVPLLVPPRTLQRQYAEHVEPMFEMIETLADQTQKLRVARDLLLPRLMSGEIAV
jgi:type I restriction enzyme, S subunit